MILKNTWKRRLVITGIFIVVLIYCLLFVFSDKLDSKEIKEFSEITSNRHSEKIKI